MCYLFYLLFRLVLIIAWKFKAQQQCEFSKDEFVGGMNDMGRLPALLLSCCLVYSPRHWGKLSYLILLCSGCDSIDKLKTKLPAMEKEITDPNKFKEFYQFTFNYAKNPAQKGLDLEMALAYWNIVMAGR